MLILLLPIFLFKESVKKLNPDSTEKMLALSPMELSMGAKDRGDKMISYFPLLPLTGFLAFDAISPLFFPIFSVSNHVDKVSLIIKGFNKVKIGKKSGKIASNAKTLVNGKRGKYDIILSPLSFAPILNSIGESASIFSVESGLSFFTDSLNKKIGSNKISIYDDGRLRNGIGSTKVDHEGVPTRRTPILEKGVHRNYLHNYSTAKKYNVQNAGNAGLISPEPWNIVVDNGDYELDEMIKSVKRGLYVTNVWY